MEIIRKIVYQPNVNTLLRLSIQPFKSLIPKSMRIPVSGVVSVTTESGGTIKMKTNQTNCLTKDVFWEGIKGYEYPTLKVFLPLVKKCRTFIDVGANIGYYSLLATVENPSLKTYAFEPMPAAYLFLQENIILNGMEHAIFPVKLAVADAPGKAEFFVTKNPKALYLEHHIGGSSSTARAKDQHSQTIDVTLESLDRFIAQEGISQVDIIKLDTEATEDKVLEGATQLIQRDRPIILCEVLPGRIEDVLQNIYDKLDYMYFLPTEKGLVQLSSLKDIPGEKDFFFVPKEKIQLVEEYLAE